MGLSVLLASGCLLHRLRFFKIGYVDEATTFISWLMNATALTHPALKVLYDVHGEMSLPQDTLDALEGYRRSQPVCTGNQALAQSQLDVYGEVLDSFFLYVKAGYPIDRLCADAS